LNFALGAQPTELQKCAGLTDGNPTFVAVVQRRVYILKTDFSSRVNLPQPAAAGDFTGLHPFWGIVRPIASGGTLADGQIDNARGRQYNRQL
jgi:hypothetical protein